MFILNRDPSPELSLSKMIFKCPNCLEESDSIDRNLSGVSLTKTNSSEGNVSVENCEMADLVHPIVPNLKEINLKKGRWNYRKSSVKFEDEDENQPPSELWKKFVRTTTGHGFARLVDPNEHWHLRIFWTLMVIFLAAGLLTSVSLISYEAVNIVLRFCVKFHKSLRKIR